MSLDWKRFKEIVEFNKEDPHAQLLNIVQQQNFITEFLTRLSKELKLITTTHEIIDKFPDAGVLLTKASTHPYFGITPSIAELLIQCLIEYAKLDLDSDNDISLESTTRSNKSIIWCIIRLRRCITASNQENHTQQTIQKISYLIDTKKYQLSAQTIIRLTDSCLGLIHTNEASEIIQKLVDCSLVDDIPDAHFDHPEPILSNNFIFQLANNNNDTHSPNLRTQYLSWPNELKMKLLTCYDDLLDFEILECIESFINIQEEYITIEALETKLMQHELIQLVLLSPHLSQRFIYHVSNYAIQFGNWKLIRFVQCVHHCISSSLQDTCKPHSYTFRIEASQMHRSLLDYIYGGGTIGDISKRRNEAWCLSLSFHRVIWHCVYQLVKWCKNDVPWSQQMDDILDYINWVVYPTMDNRESESCSFLRYWIQSCSKKGNSNKLYKELPKRWYNLLNSNEVLVTCFVTSIFFSADHLHVDQQISLIQSIFTARQNIHGNTKKANTNTCMVYLLLDYLYDIENYADMYPPVQFDTSGIKDYLLQQLL